MHDGSSQLLTGAMIRSQDGRVGRLVKLSLPWVRIQWEASSSEGAEEQSYLRGDSRVFEDFEIHTLDRGWVPMSKIVSNAKSRMESLLDDVDSLEEQQNEDEGTDEEGGDSELDESVEVTVTYPSGRESTFVLESADEVREFFAEVEEEFGEGTQIQVSEEDYSLVREALDEDSDDADFEAESIFEAKKKKSKKSSSQNPFKNKSTLGPGPGGRTMSKKNQWSCSGGNYLYTCTSKKGKTKGQVKTVDINPAKKDKYNKKYRKWRKSQA